MLKGDHINVRIAFQIRKLELSDNQWRSLRRSYMHYVKLLFDQFVGFQVFKTAILSRGLFSMRS